ncbi:MAG: glycosyltransferase, partial [Candidatus Rokuibacteriota bacterium]
MRATLIIPALDEAEVIGGLVARVPRHVVHEVIVVDNGSSDTTAHEAAQAGARVVTEPRRGYGSACWAGVS